ncbi:uncharacterized protein N7529_011070 [Penicillium soppii]|jgi:hypothetical protein|uniref:uncharacterized protein n=1 Tax=Penicillium soppii TaxID=69789 RepID=UPI0025493503|nr:uncharacterized protein N7529_011070 [Penicillium soppii]KAJ5851685.1 hypothetical protein N7529_011070 [Penicillium soppii]
MAEASLAFPMICLTLSFLFVALFYNVSIKSRIRAFHRCILLPTYRYVERKLNNRAHEAVPMSEPTDEPRDEPTDESTYETISVDEITDEPPDEPMPSPELPWFFPRSRTRSSEHQPLDDANSDLEEHSSSRITQPPGNVYFADSTVRYRNEGGYHVINFSPHTPLPNTSGSAESDEDYTDDESEHRVLAYTTRDDVNAVPNVWEFELERPIYVVDRHASAVWVERMIEWTAQTAFAMVAPPVILEVMNER